MPYYVYVLECFIDREFRNYYVGQTQNLEVRMQQHYENVRNHVTDKYTGRFDFVKLIWHKEVPTREDSIRLERYLKSLPQNEKEEYMENN